MCVKGERMKEIKDGYLRVTECLSKYNDFSKIDPLILHNACERGTKVHNYCFLYAKQEYFPEPDDNNIAGFVESFAQFFDEMVEDVIELEKRYYDKDFKITGAIDAVVRLRGSDVPVIIDYKTPVAESKTWKMQLSAYKWLYDNDLNTKEKSKRRIALMLKKDGSFPKIIEYTSPQDWELYKAALSLHRYFYG